MSTITIVDNEYAISWCYPKEKIIHHQFRKFTYGDEFRSILIQNAEAYEAHHCDKWLSDDRKLGILHPDDKAWGDKNWITRMMKAGWKYWALLLPVNITGQMSMKRLAEEFSQLGVVVKFFTDPDEARQWLEEQE